MSEPTFSPVSVVADTIVRTVELGVRITDAAIEGETTVVWCDLISSGPGRCPGCGEIGTYRNHVERAAERPAGRRAPAAAAGSGSALPLPSGGM